MHEFSVWAPRPGHVDLLLGARRLPMCQAGQGWWRLAVPDARPGTDYAFSLDGGPPRPDPRSPCQPEGIDGPSRLVDHDGFGWTDAAWTGLDWPDTVLYECHVGTFSAAGTFDGAIAHLDHLVRLGVDAIELMPVAEFSGPRGWGYDGVDLFAPHHAYGGPAGLARLVDAAHARGLGVLVDVVYNHLGPAGNYLPEFGPYFSARHRTRWGPAVNFDGPGSAEVRRFVLDNAAMWLRDFHCDGLRVDAVHAITDSSPTHILADLAAQARDLAARLGRRLVVIAESDLNQAVFVRDPADGGYGLDACWADEWHHALHAVLTGERAGYYADFGSLRLLAKALAQAWVYDGSYSPHRRRVFGESPAGLDGSRFVVCAQNHDQIGNRAAGDRLGALTSHGRLRIAAALLLTSPFVPLLFQGEEWGAATPFRYFTGHPDPGLGARVSAGRRQEFGGFGWDEKGEGEAAGEVPDPQDPATFERSKLDWAEPDRSPGPGEAGGTGGTAEPGGMSGRDGRDGLLGWYRELIALRRATPALRDRDLSRVAVDCDEQAGWLTVRRGPVLVAANLGGSACVLPAGSGPALLAASAGGIGLTGAWLTLPPDTVAVLTARPEPARSPGQHENGALLD